MTVDPSVVCCRRVLLLSTVVVCSGLVARAGAVVGTTPSSCMNSLRSTTVVLRVFIVEQKECAESLLVD